MHSRRGFLFGSTASGLFALSSRSSAATTNRYDEIEARVARGDLKNLTKEDLPTPCMVVDQEISEAWRERITAAGIQLHVAPAPPTVA